MEADGLARGLFLLSIVMPGNKYVKTKKMLQVIALANTISLLFSHLVSVDNNCYNMI